MANKFYQANELRSKKVRDLFAAIAPRYDLINDLQSFGLHRLWKKRLLQIARPAQSELALDLCCGTGDIALKLAAAGSRVVGLDFSAPMLEIARHRAPSLNPPSSILWLQADALHLPFADAQFDLVTIGYGLRNLPDLRAGLCEIRRVLKPSGRMAALDFGKPDHPLWRSMYFSYLKWLVPIFGRLFFADPETYAYILESLRHYPGQRGVATLMTELGFDRVRAVNLLGGVMGINYGVKTSQRPPKSR